MSFIRLTNEILSTNLFLNNYLCFEIRPTTTIILIGTDSLTFIMLHMRMMCVYSPIRLIITSKHKSWWCWDAWKWWWNSLIIWIRYPGCVAISFFSYSIVFFFDSDALSEIFCNRYEFIYQLLSLSYWKFKKSPFFIYCMISHVKNYHIFA